ncbi:glycosyltransferase family 9 protein [Candidatus Binatia bacterium]|nr:glycosyltransferase family 9 protein [Candidatus Binatia bacterium]
MSVKRIVVVNLTRLGDLLQTSPTIAGLHAVHPDASITVVAERNFAEVCESIPGVDHVYRVDFDGLGHLLLDGPGKVLEAYHRVRDVVTELRAERFELALNYSSSRMSAVLLGLLRIDDVRGWAMTADGHRAIRSPWARLFAASCLNRRVAAFNLVDCYRGVAGCLDAPVDGLSFRVGEPARRAVAERLTECGVGDDASLVALQLGASREVRQWPIEAFAALARALAADGHRIVLLGGAGERALAERLQGACADAASPPLDLCGRTSIQELAALLERCRLLVTGDTGPMHMAAATRTPIVGLFFGPALPFDTGPYGSGHVVLHAGVSCAPCDHAVNCLDPFCRRTLTPELVTEIVRARLAADAGRLDALATQAGRSGAVRVYRTGFDGDGLFACTALGDLAPRADDALRDAYRATWLARLAGRPLPPACGARIDAAPFAALGELARLGGQLARDLQQQATRRPPSIGAIERTGREIETLDQSIAEHGRVHPEVALLTQMFAFEKEAMAGETLDQLAPECVRLYRDLARSADDMLALLRGTATHEVSHADLRQ